MPTQIAAITSLPPATWSHPVGTRTNWTTWSPDTEVGLLNGEIDQVSYTIPAGATAIVGQRIVGTFEVHLRNYSSISGLITSFTPSVAFLLSSTKYGAYHTLATLDFGTYSAGDYTFNFDVTFDIGGSSTDTYAGLGLLPGAGAITGDYAAGGHTGYIVCNPTYAGGVFLYPTSWGDLTLTEWDILCTVPATTTGRVSVAVHPQQMAMTAAFDNGTDFVSYTHPAPHAYIGDCGNGWQGPVTIAGGNPSGPGILYLPDGRLSAVWSNGGDKRATSDDMATTWSSSSSLTLPGASATGHSDTEGWRFYATSGAINAYWQVNGQGDDTWGSSVCVSSGATSQYCGASWLSNGYGLLYTRSSDNHIMWKETGDISNWSGSATDTGKTGVVVSMVRHSSGTLAGLTWSTSTKKCRALRSNDRGVTWDMDSSDIAEIPTLDQPPHLVCHGDVVYAVYVGDTLRFSASMDAGTTWIADPCSVDTGMVVSIPSPTSHWKLDEASGTRADMTGLYGLSDSGGTAVGQTTGLIGNSATWNGTTVQVLDHADNADLSVGSGTDFTVTGYCYYSALPASYDRAIFSKGRISTNRECRLYLTTSDTFLWRVYDNTGTAFDITWNDVLPSTLVNTWVFFHVYVNSSTNEIGIGINNGTIYTTTMTNAARDQTDSFRVGIVDPVSGTASVRQAWDGRIDSLSLFRSLLSPTEVTALYNAGSGMTWNGSSWV